MVPVKLGPQLSSECFSSPPHKSWRCQSPHPARWQWHRELYEPAGCCCRGCRWPGPSDLVSPQTPPGRTTPAAWSSEKINTKHTQFELWPVNLSVSLSPYLVLLPRLERRKLSLNGCTSKKMLCSFKKAASQFILHGGLQRRITGNVFLYTSTTKTNPTPSYFILTTNCSTITFSSSVSRNEGNEWQLTKT